MWVETPFKGEDFSLLVLYGLIGMSVKDLQAIWECKGPEVARGVIFILRAMDSQSKSSHPLPHSVWIV